ncbi:MAG: hypothetical protein ABMA13_13445, partial [Chthoniobacteraceae bacterium]
SGTVDLLSDVAGEWVGILQNVGRVGVENAWRRDVFIGGGLLGLSVGSGFLCWQFVAHALGRGWRLSDRALWRFTGFHALVAGCWIVAAVITTTPSRRDFSYVVFPVCGIAAAKLALAGIALRGK